MTGFEEMTAFEQRVAKHLRNAIDEMGGDPCDVYLLAPRVVAAFEAASLGVNHRALLSPQTQLAILAALASPECRDPNDMTPCDEFLEYGGADAAYCEQSRWHQGCHLAHTWIDGRHVRLEWPMHPNAEPSYTDAQREKDENAVRGETTREPGPL